MLTVNTAKIAIIGLGYVGLPLAVEFSKSRTVVGFDINQQRIDELHKGTDVTLEVEPQDLNASEHLHFTSNLEDLRDCNTYIVTVPTPVDESKAPDLTPLIKASKAAGSVISKGDVVIYESTVFPGATEEICVPIITGKSGLTFNTDFFAGYSSERINPGDKSRRLPDIKKVTSGSTPEIATYVDALYQTIITAGTHMAPSIKVAEAAKVIENTQRDVNIALINELAMIFNKLDIDTTDVLEAAGTKWNFLPFRPGLVGGHCIGVDPYYLTHKAQSVGYDPDIVLAGRRINDGMGSYVANRLTREMEKRGITIKDSRVLIMGLTFKENCPDLRNTRVIDVISVLQKNGVNIDVHDPWVNANEAQNEYGLNLITPKDAQYDAIIIAVAHDNFKNMGISEIREFGTKNHIIFDLKSIFPKETVDIRL